MREIINERRLVERQLMDFGFTVCMEGMTGNRILQRDSTYIVVSLKSVTMWTGKERANRRVFSVKDFLSNTLTSLGSAT